MCRAVVQQVPVPSDASADTSSLERSTASSGFWTALAETGIQHKHLVSLLFYFMYTGKQPALNYEPLLQAAEEGCSKDALP